jgi:hypothetical protein
MEDTRSEGGTRRDISNKGLEDLDDLKSQTADIRNKRIGN